MTSSRKRLSSPKVVIIGAGPGGLAAGMLLSKTGADVTILEARNTVGGRTSSLSEQGFTFDLGPTFFLYPDVLKGIYSSCGFDMDKEIEMVRLKDHYKLTFEGRGEVVARGSEDFMEKQFSNVNSEDVGGFRRFMEDNRKKFSTFNRVLQKPFNSIKDLMDPQLLSALPYLRPGKSVESDLRTFFKDERLRLACAFQSKYLGMSPSNCPSIFTILSYLEYEYGIFHPKGGCGAVSRSMADMAKRLGARIKLSEPVESIEFEGSRAKSVVTNNDRYDCDALVINADFAHTMQKLVPNHLRKRWSDQEIEKKKYSCSTFMMYLGLNKTIPDLNHHSIFLSKDYKGNLEDIEKNHTLSDNPSFYVCNPCVTDPSMAPENKSSLYVLVPVTHRNGELDWEKNRDAFRSVVMNQLEKIGLSDLESSIEYEKILTPQTWENKYNIFKGAVFNLAHSLDQMLFRRPQNRFKELDGVYLVGGGTHPGSGLPVIYESAKISSRLIQEDYGI